MEQETKCFKGILFTLKKRMQSVIGEEDKFYKYLALGYYDGIDINIANNWYDLRPKGLEQYGLQVNLEDSYIDQYTIRGFFPQNQEKYESKGFRYHYWERAAERTIKDMEPNVGEMERQCPFITMSVLNLSEEYVVSKKDIEELLKGVCDILEEAAKKSGIELEHLHCAVFPVIGYSDFVVLFRTKNWEIIAKLLNCLRGEQMDIEEKHYAVVSNCYSVCGLDKSFFQNNDPELNAGAKIAIRINLREGISASAFLHKMDSEILERIKKEPGNQTLKELETGLKTAYYATFGNSDCIILPEDTTGCYLRLHGPGQILNPNEKFFKSYVISVRTSVRAKGIEGINDESVPDPNEKQDRMAEYRRQFLDFIMKYEKELHDNDMHIRSSKALQKIMKNFLNVAQTSHGFDVEHIIGMAFKSLIQDAQIYLNRKEDKEDDSQISLNRKLTVEAVEIFKDYIGDLLADMVRSDRPFIEGNTLTHPAIASAAKLLFAYCGILEKLTDKFGVTNQFSFVVISGGCDKTEAIDLFSFSDASDDLNKLILIRVPEMSLYDIQGTLFRMLHECMHFVGDRHRVQRHDFWLRAVARTIGNEIAAIAFSEKDMKLFQTVLSRFLADENKSIVDGMIERCYNERKAVIAEEFQNAFLAHPLFKEYKYKYKDDKDYYASVLKNIYLDEESLKWLFQTETNSEAEGENKQKTLFEQTYHILIRAHKELYETVYDEFSKMYAGAKAAGTSEAAIFRQGMSVLRMRKENYAYLERYPADRDEKLESFLCTYFSALVGNLPLTKKAESNWTEYEGYPELFLAVCNAMKECFSDCVSIQILDMQKEDFILAFIYELWKMEDAFPMNFESILRIGADMKVIYGIEGGLDPETRTRIKSKVERRAEQGYQYQNIDQMLARIDEILEIYAEEIDSGLKRELEEYLSICTNEKEELRSMELSELYKLCDFAESEQIYRALDRIFGEWKRLGGNKL